jgi:hypothetical protein
MLITSGFRSIELSLAGLRAPYIAGGERS